MKNELMVVEHEGIRVVTTAQLAELYGADKKTITKNFNRNMDRYIEGKHYFRLEGSDKVHFLNRGQFDSGLKNAGAIYLWTEKGALLHAKSLGTDKAWEVYDHLVETYFRAKQIIARLDSYMIEDPIERALAWAEEQRQARYQIEMLEAEIEEAREQVILTRLQVSQLSKALNDKVSARVGRRVFAYNPHYIAAKSELCAYFEARTLSEIKQMDFEDALRFIDEEI